MNKAKAKPYPQDNIITTFDFLFGAWKIVGMTMTCNPCQIIWRRGILKENCMSNGG